jgi:hypothetical protein
MAGVYDSLQSLDAAAETLSLTPQTATVNRVASIAGLSGSAQPLVEAAMTAKTGQTVGPVVVDDGAVLFHVLRQSSYDPASFETQRKSLIESLRQNEFRSLRASLIAGLREGANIAINQDFMRTEMAPLNAGM